MTTTFSVNLEDLIFTRNDSSNDLVVTGKNGQDIAGEGVKSVTITDFQNNDTITTSDLTNASIKEKATLNVVLSNGSTYVASADYTERISFASSNANADVSGLGANDTIALNGETDYTYEYYVGKHSTYNYVTLLVTDEAGHGLKITDFFSREAGHSSGFNVVEVGAESEQVVNFGDKTLNMTYVRGNMLADGTGQTDGVKDHYYIYNYVAENQIFKNVNVHEYTQDKNKVGGSIHGGSGDDILTSQNNYNSTLKGNAGSDTFRYYLGAYSNSKSIGTDTIVDPTADDKIVIAHHNWNALNGKNVYYVDFDNLEFTRDGNNLIININYPDGWLEDATDSSITLQNFFNSELIANPLDMIQIETPEGYKFYEGGSSWTVQVVDEKRLYINGETVKMYSELTAEEKEVYVPVSDVSQLKDTIYEDNYMADMIGTQILTEYAISDDALINYELSDGETFDANGYNYNFTLATDADDIHVSNMGEDSVIKIGGETVAYSRVDNSGLIINGRIEVTDFNFDGQHDINVNDGTTEEMTINVTLTGALNGAYESAAGYAEKITTIGDSSILFYPEGYYTGQDTLVFDTDNITYKRSGDDLVITYHTGVENEISTTVLGYYTSDNMAEEGQFARAQVSAGEINTTLGDLEVSFIENVSNITGTDNEEAIELVTTTGVIPQNASGDFPNYDEETGEYTSNVGHGKIKIDAYAAGMGGDDLIEGTAGNDWINGGDGDDTIYGGTSGKDMLAGGDGENTILAGDFSGETPAPNTDGVEIYGGKDKDTIYVGGNNETENYIWAHGGNDVINLYGGKNTIMLVEDGAEAKAGNDTIYGATALDTLKFVSRDGDGQVIKGFAVSDLTFAKSGDDLTITTPDASVTTIADFFKGQNVDAILTSDSETPHSIKDDAVINVTVAEGEIHKATGYKENITLANGTTTVEFDLGSGSDTITLQEGQKLILKYNDMDTDRKTQNPNFKLDGTTLIMTRTVEVGKYDVLTIENYLTYGEGNVFYGSTDLKLEDTMWANAEFKDENSVFGYSSSSPIKPQAGDPFVGSFLSENIAGYASLESHNISGGGGNDLIKGSFGNDILNGDAGRDKIYGGNGADTIHGGEGDDILIGENGEDLLYGDAGADQLFGGKDNDTLTGGEGNDTFVFNAGDGSDKITDAEEGDIIKFNNKTFSELGFIKNGDDLEIAYGTNDTVVVNDFFKGQNVDAILTSDSETAHSIKNDAVINVVLTNGEAFDASLGGYNYAISGNGSVTNMGANDKLVTSGESVEYMRKNDGGLIVWSGNGELQTDKITVTDFVFDGAHDINVNKGTTENMILNVDLDGTVTYAATSYAEIFSGVGSVTGFVNSKDGVVPKGSPVLIRENNSTDLSVDGITIKNFDFSVNNPFKIFDGNTYTQSTDYPINVTLFDVGGEPTEYQSTGYKEYIDGKGIVNLSGDHPFDLSQDAVYVDGWSGIHYTRENNWDLHVVQEDKTDITVKGFNFAGGTDFMVTDGTETELTTNMTIDVTLTGIIGDDYHSASGYAERITTKTSTAIQFAENSDKDTLVFDTTADNITYRRNGNNLYVINKAGEDEIYTIIKGYYTSTDMSVAGQFAGVKVDTTSADTTLGNLSVTEIENVSNITGTDKGENIYLEKLTEGVIPQNASGDFPNYDEETGKYTSNVLGNREVKIDAYAAGMGGDDVIYGTEGNDWINGGDGNDLIVGGASGKDMLAGGDGQNEIYAGTFVDNKFKPNEDGVEIYGGKGLDMIYAGGNNETENYIWAHGGNDVINLYGGKNTIMLVEDNGSSYGNDTITGASALDTLKFVSRDGKGDVISGYNFADLAFTKDGDDLIITTPNNNTVTIAEFFTATSKVDIVKTADRVDAHSIKSDVVFDVVLDSEHPTFNKATSEYAGYRVNVIANDSAVKYTIEGLSATDNVTTGSATYEYTKYDGQSNRLFVNNVELVNYESDVKIDGNAIDYANSTVNYIMSNQYSQYNPYNHGFGAALISGKGQINSFAFGENDKLVLDVTSVDEEDNPLYSFTYDDNKHWDNDALVITDGTNRFQVDGASISVYNFIPPVKDLNLANVELDVVNVLNSFDATTFPGGFGSVNVSAYDSGVDVTLTGATGDDTLRGASGNDTITGGKGDDVLYGKGGNDTFVFNAEDGEDLIMDAKEGDIINFGNKTFSELGFIKNDDDLEIAYGNNDTVVVNDFFKGQNVDAILTTDSEISHSIKDEAVFNISLANGQTFDKAQEGYTGYNVKVSLLLGAESATVANLETGDELVTTTENIKRSGNDLVLDTITVKDYYTSPDMSVEGKFSGVAVGDTLLGLLNVTDIEKVSNITGTDNGESIQLVKTEGVILQNASGDFPNYDEETGKYTSNVLGNRVVKIDAYAAGMGGNDLIEGTEGNDWINGGDGDDVIVGGTKGKDMLAGGDGKNTIYAGGLSGESVTLNTDGVEIYGGKDTDVIFVGGNNNTENYIWAHGGDDVINVNGGKNTIMLVEDDGSSYGSDKIVGATANDTLKFVSRVDANKTVGAKFEDMSFTKNGDDLKITVGDDVTTIDDFFRANSKVDTILTTDGEKSIKDDAVINVEITQAGEYSASDYKEAYTIASGIAGNVIIHNLDGQKDSITLNDVNFDDITFFHRDGRLDMAYGNTLVLLAGYDSAANKLSSITTNDGTYGFAVGNDATEFSFSTESTGNNIIIGALDGDKLNFTNIDANKVLYTRNAYGDLVVTVEDQADFAVTLKGFFSADVHKSAHLDTIKFNDSDDDVSILKDAEINVNADSYFLGYNVVDDAATAEVGGYNEIIDVTSGNLSKIDINDAVLNAISSGDITKTLDETGYHYTLALGKDKELASIIVGQLGDDTIYDSEGNDYLAGANGDDKIYSTKGEDALIGGAGADYLYAKDNTSDVEIYGGAGNDEINSGSGNDFIWGGSGNDDIILNGGNNRIILSDNDFGSDTIYNATANDKLEFVLRQDGEVVQGHDFDELTFVRKNADLEIFVGNNSKATISGFFNAESPVDTIIAEDGTYSIKETEINVVLTGGETFDASGDYKYAISGNGSVKGLDKDKDIIKFSGTPTYTLIEIPGSAGPSANLKITCGDNESITVLDDYLQGNEPVVYAGSTLDKIANQTLNITGLNAFVTSENFKFRDVNITGTAGDDEYIGSAGNDIINGGKGDDIIKGGEGNDTLNGGEGVNQIHTGSGNDSVVATTGANTIYVDDFGHKVITSGSSDGNTFVFSKGTAVINGATAKDTIEFATFDPSKVEFVKEGDDLVIKSLVEGDNDTITISDYFNGHTITKFVLGKTETELNLEYKQSNVDGESYLYNVITGTEDPDTIPAIEGIRNWINAAGGNDKITGGDKKDMLAGNADDDVIVASNTAEIYGGEGKDEIYALGGDSFVAGGLGDDTITVAGGNNTIAFVDTTRGESAKDFGMDVVDGAKAGDVLKFSVDYGDTIQAIDGYTFSELSVEKDGVDLIVKAGNNSVTLNDYFTQKEEDRVSAIQALVKDDSTGVYTQVTKADELTALVNKYIYAPERTYDEDKIEAVKGQIVIDKNAEGGEYKINAAEYVSETAKGITVNNKNKLAGLDIAGSLFNDTITTKNDVSNTIIENGGTNKITTGNADDVVIAGDYSNNTINVGKGDNTVTLESTGINKVTASNGNNDVNVYAGSNNIKLGNGANEIGIAGGVNTVKTGKGANTVLITDGVNKVTTGKGKDGIIIAGGNNNISSGTGEDVYNIVDGYNTIKTGNAATTFNISDSYDIKDGDVTVATVEGDGGVNVITSGSKNDTFNIDAGVNTIKSGSGVDTFYLNGGTKNIVDAGAGNDNFNINAGTNYLNGAAGNDNYIVNLTAENGFDFENGDILITDTKGKNVLDLTMDVTGGTRDALNLFFDVDLKTKKNGDVIVKKNNASYTYSTMTFTTDDIDENFDGDAVGIDVSSKKSISTVKINGTEYAINTKEIDALAQEVANWLNTNNFASTTEAFADETGKDLSGLIAAYTKFNDTHFGNPTA